MTTKTFREAASLGACAVFVLLQAAATPACVVRYSTPVASRPLPPPVREAPAPVAEYGPEEQPFYEDLQPYGEWVYVEGPGWAWSPYNVAAGWRPYTMGHWALTDDGWTWASDEEFGWATYHYGRWQVDARYGWVWAPGTEWAPAWVAWHEGSGWVGWAPLPYQVSWHAGIGFDWGGVDVNVALGPSSWCFVEARHMVTPSVGVYIAPVTRNVTLIHNTVNVTNYVTVNNRVVNQSVHPDQIGRALGHPVPRYRLEQVTDPVAARGGRIDGDRMAVYRPDPRRGGEPQRRDLPPGHDGWNGRERHEAHDEPVAATEDEPALNHGPRSHPSRPQDLPQPAHGNPHTRPPVNARPPMAPPQAATPSHPAPVQASPAHGGGPASTAAHPGANPPPPQAPASNQHVPPGQAKKPQSDAKTHGNGHPKEKDCSKPDAQGCNSE
jgi:hypothetical protein